MQQLSNCDRWLQTIYFSRCLKIDEPSSSGSVQSKRIIK